MSSNKWLPFSHQILHILKCAVTEWIAHRAASKGAALSFYMLFSMAPILVLVISIAGLFYGEKAAEGQLLNELGKLVGPQGADAIQGVLAGAKNKEGGVIATVIATVLLLVGATTVFAELKDSLDEIWNVPAPADASWWDTVLTRVLSFGLILALGFLLMVSLVLSAALAVLEKYFSHMWSEATLIMGWVSWAVSFLVIAALFGVIYKLLPRISLSWRDVAIGALGTAVLFTLGKYGIGLYLGTSAAATSFGAAGSLIAVLLWVYYSSQIFFLGAEFARQYALQLGSLRDRPASETGASHVERLP